MAKTGWRGSPALRGAGAGAGRAGPHSLDARLHFGQWTGPSLVELPLVRGPQSGLASRGAAGCPSCGSTSGGGTRGPAGPGVTTSGSFCLVTFHLKAGLLSI